MSEELVRFTGGAVALLTATQTSLAGRGLAALQLRSDAATTAADALFQQGMDYWHGSLLVPMDVDNAIRRFQQAANLGFRKAQLQMAVISNRSTALKNEQDQFNILWQWCKDQANAGDAFCQVTLGDFYDYRFGSSQNSDLELAAHWYKESAIGGNSDAQFKLGLLYFHGEGLEANNNLSFFWCKKSAEQGHAQAMEMLGVHYETANDYEGDEREKLCFEWFLKSAKQGFPPARFAVGQRYRRGLGVEQSAQQAFFWLSKAAEDGFPAAQHALDDYYQYGFDEEHLSEQYKIDNNIKPRLVSELNINIKKAIYWYEKSIDGMSDGCSNKAIVEISKLKAQLKK